MNSTAGVILDLVLLVFGIALWLLPIGVARHRRVRGIGMIVVITLLLGWTLIGWVVALAMAFTSNVRPLPDDASTHALDG
jgi:CHASE2 domain-containing sensor protein